MKYFVLFRHCQHTETDMLFICRLTRYGSGTISDTTPSQRNVAAARKTVKKRPSPPEVLLFPLKRRRCKIKAIGTAPAAHVANWNFAAMAKASEAFDAMLAMRVLNQLNTIRNKAQKCASA